MSLTRAEVIVRQLDRDEADHMRAEIVRLLLSQTIAGLRHELDPAAWANGGWNELAAFVDALCGTGAHPALTEWAATQAKAGRPAPSNRESYARRLVVLMCAALERAGLNRRNARRFAVAELAGAGLFVGISAKTIERWQEKAPLGPDEELLTATGFATAGGEPRRLGLYFIGLIHLTLNPTATIVDEESARKTRDYIGHFVVG
jgi:hypothetical protein